MKKFYVGAAYYPELWSTDEVDKDIAHCREIGLNVLRVGEFAWSKMEPREGEFDFDWLIAVLDKLYAAGISAVVCTPTCTPPRYMMDKYPEMRSVNDEGVRAEVSWRCHPCKTVKIMREKNRIIVTQLARAVGKHPTVIGWQIDNEFTPYGDGCFCPHCVEAFRDWLRGKFGDINALNRAWGMDRWSLDYDSFESVLPPRKNQGQWLHPSLVKAWWDFQCAQIVSYSDEQAEILRKYSSAPIGTDMMTHNNLGYYALNKRLDVVQLNHYNKASELRHMAFWYDFLRPIKPALFWVTETQVGWNGGNTADSGYRPTGNCYVNSFLPIAYGGTMNMYWLFRAHRNGHELAHGALLSTAGRPYRVADEVKRFSAELDKCADILGETEITSDIAVHFSSTAANTFMAAPMLAGFDYTAAVRGVHSAFSHHNVDVIDTEHSLDGYKYVISPFLANACENGLEQRIKRFVENGGAWIVGPMSDIFDENVTQYTAAPFSFLEEFAGVYTKYRRPIDNADFKAKWKDGTDCGISRCYDAFSCNDGTVPLAVYDGGEFDGLAVVAERRIGKGRVIIAGSVLDGQSWRRLVDLPPIAVASDNVLLVERNGKSQCIVVTETENERGFVILNGKYVDVVSGKTLSGKCAVEPYSVKVLKRV